MRPSTLQRLTRCSCRVSRPAILPSYTFSIHPPNIQAYVNTSRQFSTSLPLLKKSKASNSRDKHREEAEDAPVDGKDEEITVDKLPGVLAKAEGKMGKSVEWARVLIYEGVERGRGRVSPSLLDGIKIDTGEGGGSQPLNALASITVKANTLLVSVWDESHLRVVESAIHEANLPGVSPQRIDSSTIRIPISRPTHEQRQQLLKNIGKTVETAKNQVRHARTEGLNALGGRGKDGTDDVEKLAADYGKKLEDSFSQAKKEFEKA